MIYEFDGYKPVIDPSSFIHKEATIIGNVIIGKDDNSDVRAIMITANGKAFCAGQDLAEAIDPAYNFCHRSNKTDCHNIEAFGPVSTILPYKTIDQAIPGNALL